MLGPTDPAEDADDLDDYALRWAGGEEQGRARPRLATPPGDASSLESVEVEVDAGTVDERAPRDVPGALAAVVAGILYLALTVGWIYSVQQTSSPSSDLFPVVVWQFGEFTAMIAAPIWFAAVMALTRGRIGQRLGWFALGLGVLLPWPMLLGLAG